MTQANDLDISQVEGNASPEVKRTLLSRMAYLRRVQVSRLTGQPFRDIEGQLVLELRVTEASILPKAEEPDKPEGRVVFEVIADESTHFPSES